MSCHYTRIFKNILIFLSESGLKDSQDYESGFGYPSYQSHLVLHISFIYVNVFLL